MRPMTCLAVLAAFAAFHGTATASSHMDAPLITLDDAANTTDVYAFVSKSNAGVKYLSTAVAVYPFEEPGIGPNKHNFDDSVTYGIHVATGPDVALGKATFSYYFEFKTNFKNTKTILQSYTGVVQNVDDPSQNLTQRYSVVRIDNRTGARELLGGGLVPPNNQGIATPHYNAAAGNGPALEGVSRTQPLDRYTAQTVSTLKRGYQSFAGQRDDGFYADVQAVFDLLQLRGPGEAQDTQRGYNVHTIGLNIPVSELGGEMQAVGVYANTYRHKVKVLFENQNPIRFGEPVQVARQGNPLFNEGFVALEAKDVYSRTTPELDRTLFQRYALAPELAKLINAILFPGNPIPGIETNRTDLAGIFIPDLIKIDLSTDAVRLAGGGPSHPTNPDDPGFSRLSVFGGDTVFSKLANGNVPGGWPNGRRFGDDVLDIGVSAIISDLRVNPPVIRVAGDNVDGNDIAYNKVFPYAATPLNGRLHAHH